MSTNKKPVQIIEDCSLSIDISDENRVRAFSLKRLEPAFVNSVYALFFNGSLEVITSGAAPKRLDFYCTGRVLGTGSGRVEKAHKRSGFLSEKTTVYKMELDVALNLIGSPPDATIEIYLVFGPIDKVKLGEIKVRRKPLQTSYNVKYNPVIIHSLGRSGTTWLMHYLREHPQIFIHGRYPHELLGAHYWYNMLTSLTSPLSQKQHIKEWQMRDFETKSVTPHLYYKLGADLHGAQFIGSRYVEMMADFCKQSVDEFYNFLIENEEEIKSGNKTERKYFSEKGLPSPALLKEIYPAAKEVFLVRDIRDNISSCLAFNKKRGTLDFGRTLVNSDDEFVIWRATRFKERLGYFFLCNPRPHLIHYENLMSAPITTMTNLLEYLELDAKKQTVTEMYERARQSSTDFDFHKTAAADENSVERWRSDLTPEQQKMCWKIAGELLTGFGYAP